MRRQPSPLGSGQTPACFRLLNTIASAEERALLALSRERKQQAAPSEISGTTTVKIPSLLLRFMQQGKLLVTGLMSRAGVSCTSRTRQMRVIEQLAVGKATLVLVDVAGERLLVSLQQGSSATVTPLSIDSPEAENSLSGPQRVESRR